MITIARATVPAAAMTRSRRVAGRTRFGLVGSGWRSSIYLRMAYMMPERFELVGVVTRRPEAGTELARDWEVRTFLDVGELVAEARPDFVVVAVPWAVTPTLIRQLVSVGMPVLAETPPAPDADGLRSLWSDVGASALVQVAEQYWMMPMHVARLKLVEAGVIGKPTSVLISSTHGYHAVSLIRRYLGVGLEPAIVRAQTFSSDLIDPITPAGWRNDLATHVAETTLATIDFGSGRVGRYDFTSNQWWNPVRPDHLIVRGSSGEICDDVVVRMQDAVTPVCSRIESSITGRGMNFEGFDLSHLSMGGDILYRNEFEGARLSEDELSVADMLARMGRWVLGQGEPPYPLAEACHDHLLGLAIEEAVVSKDAVATTMESWARSGRIEDPSASLEGAGSSTQRAGIVSENESAQIVPLDS